MGPYLVLRRPARQVPDDGSADKITVPTPPRDNDEDLDRSTWIQSILPMVGMLGFMGFILFRPSVLFVAVGVLWMVGMVGASVGMRMDSGRRVRKKRVRARRRYFNQLAEVRTDVRTSVRKQWTASARRHPEPDQLLSMTRYPNRLWERRPHHEDFLRVRYGVGQAVLTADLRLPPDVASQASVYDPVCAYQVSRLLDSIVRVDGAPLDVDLRQSRWTMLAGDTERTRGAARSILAQSALWHGPDDVRLIVATAPERAHLWTWTRWLPHVRWCESDLPGGSLMLTDATVLENVLIQLVSSRQSALASQGSTRAGETRMFDGAHVLVVVDGLRIDEESEAVQLLWKTAGLGLTMIELTGPDFKWEPPWVDRLMVIDEKGILQRGPDTEHNAFVGASVDCVDLEVCESLARRLAPWRIPGQSLSDSVRSPDVTELLGIDRLAELTPETAWLPISEAESLRVPIGSSPDGAPVVLDLKETAQGGMGPHGLMVGATGSGKSELLRTLVVGMALRHSPELLSFVLVDFKGGATFAGLSDLPQVSAVITNLEDQLELVDRLHDALNGELARRQEMLSAAGNVASATEYRRLRESKPEMGLEPLPSVLVIVDEFSELITARPDFVDTFVAIGRVGRSLGIHLLLASQRLEEGKLRGLDSHVSYRVALRTFSPADSSAAIGVRDAYYLPPVPGSGILTVGTSVFQRFRAAHVSAAYDSDPESARRGMITALDPVRAAFGLVSSGEEDERDEQDEGPSEYELSRPIAGTSTIATVAVDRLHDERRRVHKIWLPPLSRRIELGSVLKDLRVHPDRGLVAYDWAKVGQLQVPMGVIDLPKQQRMEILSPVLGGAHGSMLVVGAPQTGKSTFLKNLVLAAALTHTPTEMQFYCIDLGGGSLLELDRLPHVGAVGLRSNRDKIVRTMTFIRTAMDAREHLFNSRGINTVEEFRRMRRDGELPGEILGDVFVLLDGYLEFREEYEDYANATIDISTRGPGLGFHLIITAARAMDVRSSLRDNIAGRLELRINDPMDSVIDRHLAAKIPMDWAGRGITADKKNFQTLHPAVTAPASVRTSDGAEQDIYTLVADSWTGPCAPEVRVLPSRLSAADLPQVGRDDEDGVPVGLDERELAPVRLTLRGSESHFIVLGDSESGKTNLLRTYVQGLVARQKPDHAALFIVDYRLTLFEVAPEEFVRAYSSSASTTQDAVRDIVGIMESRTPPAGLSSQQLRTRGWWEGPEVYVVVDDYDLVVPGLENILDPLAPYIPNGHEYGLHIIASRKIGGASRALFDKVLGRMKEFGSPGIMFSGDRHEGQLLGAQRPGMFPQGRGMLVRRREPPTMVQVGWSGAAEDELIGTGNGQSDDATS